MKLAILLALQVMPLMAQQQAKTTGIFTSPNFTVVENPPSAEWKAFMKDGTYHADFTDPTNKFRCHVGGIVDNGLQGITAFTVVCAKIEEVPDISEKPAVK